MHLDPPSIPPVSPICSHWIPINHHVCCLYWIPNVGYIFIICIYISHHGIVQFVGYIHPYIPTYPHCIPHYNEYPVVGYILISLSKLDMNIIHMKCNPHCWLYFHIKMCIYICIILYIYIYTCTCTYIYIYIFIHCIYIYIHTYTVSICVYIYVHIYIYILISGYIYNYIYMYMYIYTL